MKREIKLTNKQFAEELYASFKENKINSTLTESDKKFVISYEIKADAESPDGCCENGNEEEVTMEKVALAMQYVYSVMDSRFQYVYNSLDGIYNWMSMHSQGHLPNLSPSSLQKLIDVAGMGDDYKVAPRVIYASNNSVDFNVQELNAAIKKINDTNSPSGDGEVSKLMDVIRSQKK